MSRQKLILMSSKAMDENKKDGRNEHELIRMSKAVRQNLGFNDVVEIYPETEDAEKRLNSAILLHIYQAFSDDLNKAKAELSEEDFKRVGFVSSKIFYRITGSKAKQPKNNIWISDNIYDTVIGADPEFLLFDDERKIVRANNVLAHDGLIGCDGAMAEIRPIPAISPDGLVENIRTLLKDDKHVGKIKKYDWVAGCYFKDDVRDYPIGGHIHIGNPIQIAKIEMTNRVNFFKSFNKVLDELLAIPMVKIDGVALGKARRTECTMGKYGYFGEFRTCNGRLEHRTLSGMWLMHPTLASCVLGTAKAIIDEVYKYVAYNNYELQYMFPDTLRNAQIWNENFNGWDEVLLLQNMECTTSSKDMIGMLHNSAANKITTSFVNKWYKRMKRLSTYDTYAKHVDGLYEILKSKTEVFENYDKSLKKAWLDDIKFI